MTILETHIVPKGTEEIRLYDYAAQIFPNLPSRKAIKKAIARAEILVDGKTSSTGHWVKEGQEIQLLESDVNPPKAYDLVLELVYEDDYLAVINKPAGIPVSGNQYRTIQNALIDNIQLSTQKDALRWVKPVHRLDSPTSGLLIIAKTAKTLVKLGQLFEQKLIHKKYQAIVIGLPHQKGIIDTDIEGLPSQTAYEVLDTVKSLKNEQLSLLELSPKTGRTHQIRIHLSKMGFPIMGDQLYAKDGEVFMGKGLFLCAMELQFKHPITNENLVIKNRLPHKFKSLLDREQRRWEKYNK